ncbi:hypothetical protein BH23PLA1_BH23PLA1_43270 [soil metagenome]
MGPKQAIYIIAGICAVLTVLVLGWYASFFFKYSWSRNPNHWGVFGDYVGGVLNPIFAVINITVVIYIAFAIRQLEETTEEARRQSEQRQNAVKLVDTIQSIQYYKEVAAPVWEIAVKWRWWVGVRGDSYRLAVVSGYTGHLNKYSEFEFPEKIPLHNHNLIRFGDHFHPSDYNATGHQDGYIQSVLSEHQSLSCWLEFWGNVNVMISEGLVDKSTATNLLSDWYFYWADFMIELRMVVAKIYDSEKRDNNSTIPYPKIRPRWIDELDKLKDIFYVQLGSKDDCKHYKSLEQKSEERANDVFKAISKIKDDDHDLYFKKSLLAR